MEKIKIQFLGTGNAIPTKKRNHTAILLSYKSENILVDCGEGTQRQFRIAGISPTKLTKILITHWHGDHTLGLTGLFQTLAMSNYQKTLGIYGPRGTGHYLDLLKGIWNIEIKLKVHELQGRIIEDSELYIEAKPMKHLGAALAYSFVVKDKRRLKKEKVKRLKLPNSPLLKQLQQGRDVFINGKKIKAKELTYVEKGKKITFVLDTAFNSNAIELARNSDLLICESSFSKEEEKQAKEYKHLTASEAAMIAKRARVKKLILTHISQRYEHNFKKIKEEAEKIFKNVRIANDFDVVEL